MQCLLRVSQNEEGYNMRRNLKLLGNYLWGKGDRWIFLATLMLLSVMLCFTGTQLFLALEMREATSEQHEIMRMMLEEQLEIMRTMLRAIQMNFLPKGKTPLHP